MEPELPDALSPPRTLQFGVWGLGSLNLKPKAPSFMGSLLPIPHKMGSLFGPNFEGVLRRGVEENSIFKLKPQTWQTLSKTLALLLNIHHEILQGPRFQHPHLKAHAFELQM